MTQIELIDKLCTVNTLLTDIVKEQAEIMAQYGIELMGIEDGGENGLDNLYKKCKRAEDENDAIEVGLRSIL